MTGKRTEHRTKALVAFVALVALLVGCGDEISEEERRAVAAAGLGDPDRGKIAIRQYACVSCHITPGIVGPNVRVGPRLQGIANRQYIAGVLSNTPENMIRWIRNPAAVDPLTAMPDMGVSEAHARDIAAYLYSLD